MRSGLPLTAIVLAGDRVSDDPVTRTAGVPCRALVPVGGGLPRNASYRAQVPGRRGLWIQPVRVPDRARPFSGGVLGRQVEGLRKRPIQLTSRLGWVPALGLFFGWFSLTSGSRPTLTASGPLARRGRYPPSRQHSLPRSTSGLG